MSDTHARLIYMANQIARNFGTMPDARAAAATAEHITAFWDRRMKQAVLTGDRGGLSAVAAAAIDLLES